MTETLATLTPILGHVAGVPIEEALPGVLAVGAVGARIASEWVRRRFRRRSASGKGAGRGGHAE